jgi:hypothetical protein
MTQLGNTAGNARAVKAFKNFSLDRTSINSHVGRSFYGSVFFLVKSGIFVTLRT